MLMSHFTCIKTQIKDRPNLIEALQLLGHDIEENKVLVVNNAAHADEHPEFFAEVAIRNDIGFRWNKNTENYELVAELDTWDLDVPVSRFIDKVTQQYARTTLYNVVKEEGFQVEEEWEMDDNSIELTVSRWV
tara:strand:+ start:144 stop:542 length:399 start_codon:yes stop_codon:yes gene_type:complete